FYDPALLASVLTTSLHDALPISRGRLRRHHLHGRGVEPLQPRASRLVGWHVGQAHPGVRHGPPGTARGPGHPEGTGGDLGRLEGDRKSTRLNSSHVSISYAVFCL